MVVSSVASGLIKRTGLLVVRLVVVEIEQSLMAQVSSDPTIGSGVISAISEILKYLLRSASVETNFW